MRALRRDAITRRRLLSGAAGAGAAGGLGARLLAPDADADARSRPLSDEEVLRRTLAVELLAVRLYERVLASRTLGSSAEQLAAQLLAHEREHVLTLSQALGGLAQHTGAGAASAASTAREQPTPAARRLAGSSSHLGNAKDSLRLLIDLEEVTIGAYDQAVRQLRAPGALRTAAAIMATEAQHAMALSGLLHPVDMTKVVPDAFVEGRR